MFPWVMSRFVSGDMLEHPQDKCIIESPNRQLIFHSPVVDDRGTTKGAARCVAIGYLRHGSNALRAHQVGARKRDAN